MTRIISEGKQNDVKHIGEKQLSYIWSDRDKHKPYIKGDKILKIVRGILKI